MKSKANQKNGKIDQTNRNKRENRELGDSAKCGKRIGIKMNAIFGQKTEMELERKK